MNLSKIHHIAIIVFDYEAAKDFYVVSAKYCYITHELRLHQNNESMKLFL